MKTILVTGADGMIGSRLVQVLTENGYRVIGVGRRGENTDDGTYRHVVLDLSCREKLAELVKENKVDRVIHLAALAHQKSGKKPSTEDYRHNNVECAENVFAAAKDCPVLFISTVDVYGFTSGQVDENTDISPISPYAKSKAAAEKACRKLPRYSIFRLSPVYTDEIKRDIQKRYYLRYPRIAYLVGKGTEFEALNRETAVAEMLSWCSCEPENDIRILRDSKRMNTAECIAGEKAAGRAKMVLRFPAWLVAAGYKLLKALTGKNRYTYLIGKAVRPLITK